MDSRLRHSDLRTRRKWKSRFPGHKARLKRLVEEDRRFRFEAKAEDTDRILYTRQSYREFPDLWVADLQLGDRRKLSDVNPQIERFAWGSAGSQSFRLWMGTSLTMPMIS